MDKKKLKKTWINFKRAYVEGGKGGRQWKKKSWPLKSLDFPNLQTKRTTWGLGSKIVLKEKGGGEKKEV